MKILRNICLLFIVPILSCGVKKTTTTNHLDRVVLYKQVSTGTDSNFSFDKSFFWKDNFKEHTFIYQIFDNNDYKNIIDKVKKKDFKGNIDPEYFNSVIYAFVVEQKNKKDNDTVYYDGSKRWWIKEKGIIKFYEDKETKLAEELKQSYPIFGNCY